MIKVVTTLSRRAGMSTPDFRDYYESHHRLIGEKYLGGFAARYLRRYLDPLPGGGGTPPIDELVLESLGTLHNFSRGDRCCVGHSNFYCLQINLSG